MQQSKPSIFRSAAIQRYAQGHNRVVLPHTVAPRIVTVLWILLGLLLCSAFMIWSFIGISVLPLFRQMVTG